MNVRWPCIALLAVLTLSGCTTLDSGVGAGEPQPSEMDKLRERMDRAEDRLNGLQMEQARLQNDFDALSKSVRGADTVSRSDLADIERRIQLLDAARDAEKKAIIDQLSQRIAEIMNGRQAKESSIAADSKARTQTGYEHVVKPRETLSGIAAAYKTTAAALMKANNLKDASLLRPGQKLFVPE